MLQSARIRVFSKAIVFQDPQLFGVRSFLGPAAFQAPQLFRHRGLSEPTAFRGPESFRVRSFSGSAAFRGSYLFRLRDLSGLASFQAPSYTALSLIYSCRPRAEGPKYLYRSAHSRPYCFPTSLSDGVPLICFEYLSSMKCFM